MARSVHRHLKETDMKTFLTAALTLSLLGSTAAVAQPYGYDHRPDRHVQRMDRHDDRHDHRRGSMRHWNRGERLPASYRTRDHYVDYRAHHLRPPPRGYRWVEADNNYALVAITTGLIAAIIASN
jgi:Ni/Co efflux regulator RcnB